jgi:NADH-quinone oxidoreductase subunit J
MMLVGLGFVLCLMLMALAGVVFIGGISVAGLNAGHVVFALVASVLVLAALGVVVNRSPIRSALSLVVTLFLLAVMFVSLDANVVAMLQIVVYAGAIMVLFLFVIMLLSLHEDRPAMVRVGVRGVAGFAGTLFFLGVVHSLVHSQGPTQPVASVPEGFGSIEALAESLFTRGLLPFEVTSILLLVAIVGAVVLAKRKLV